MQLSGKTVLFLGDSITEGVGASSPERSYVPVFQRLSGANAVNYGIGGTRIARQRRPSQPPEFDRDFVSRVDEMQPEADVVVVFGGTNDFGHGDAPMGTFDSRDVYSFYGALHLLCERLIEKYTGAAIIFLTPLHRLSEEQTINEIGLSVQPLHCYVEAIQKVAGYYALPVLDLFHTSGIQPRLEASRIAYMPDGLHPSDAGAERIARRLIAFLGSL